MYYNKYTTGIETGCEQECTSLLIKYKWEHIQMYFSFCIVIHNLRLCKNELHKMFRYNYESVDGSYVLHIIVIGH